MYARLIHTSPNSFAVTAADGLALTTSPWMQKGPFFEVNVIDAFEGEPPETVGPSVFTGNCNTLSSSGFAVLEDCGS
jgi:hypothetical protein